MLVLTRKIGETINIGIDVKVQVRDVQVNPVRVEGMPGDICYFSIAY